jgi:hypothetical protein
MEVIWAAANALTEGLDSPSLRVLAGASQSDRADEIWPLVGATLQELGIPTPGSVPPWRRIEEGGQTFSRLPSDTIRFNVVPAGGDNAGFELLVYINDVEVTSKGAGMGMDPFHVLIPENRLSASTDVTNAPIARCECGEYGCGSSDVAIARDGNVVHWDWHGDVPLDHGVSCDADEYDAEVARIGSDRSWERPEDTTARIVLQQADRELLAVNGLKLSWAVKDYRDPGKFMVSLMTADTAYQIFLRFDAEGLTPEQLAANVVEALARAPKWWQATFSSTRPKVSKRPPMSSRRWRREVFG